MKLNDMKKFAQKFTRSSYPSADSDILERFERFGREREVSRVSKYQLNNASEP